jgi:hypothetical protein
MSTSTHISSYLDQYVSNHAESTPISDMVRELSRVGYTPFEISHAFKRWIDSPHQESISIEPSSEENQDGN